MPLHPRPRPPDDTDDTDVAGDSVGEDVAPDTAGIFTARRITTDGDRHSPLLLRIGTRTAELLHPRVPADLTGPGGIIGSLAADGSLTMGELRIYLMEDAPDHVIDRAWRYVIDQFRADYATTVDRRAGWDLFALGLANPGLIKQADILAQRTSPPWWTQRVHTDLAINFLSRMATIDTGTERVLWRLLRQTREATSHRGRGSAHQDQRHHRAIDLDDYLAAAAARGDPRDLDRLAHRSPHGHPLRALAELVEATRDQPPGKRLTIGDARLIAYTHLLGHTVAEAADLLGLSEPTARGRHHRAKHLIATLLTPAKPESRRSGRTN